MKTALLILLCASFAGCAAPTVYGKQGADAAQERQDFSEFRYEAAMATGSSASSGLRDMGSDIATAIRQGELMRMCLEQKGYRQQ